MLLAARTPPRLRKTAMRIFVLAHSLKRTRARNKISMADMPRFVVEHGFAGMEVSDRQFAGRGEAELRRFAAACAQSGCGLIFDVNADLTAADGALRAVEAAHARSMIALASLVGAERLRVCIGGQSLSVQRLFRRRRGRPAGGLNEVPDSVPAALYLESGIMRLGHLLRESLPARVHGQERKTERAIAELLPLAAEAGKLGLRIGIENHWGVSAEPGNVVRIIAAVGSPWLGSCPDLGNFPRGIDPEAGLRLLAPYAVILHAKSYGFRPDGRERRIDYSRLLPLFSSVGFTGPITVEFEGLGDDLAGCLKTRDLVMQNWPA
jgi:sugar phosphate isomerase/epimerase